MAALKIPLDSQVIDLIAAIICGDAGPRYLRGYEIPLYFRRAGLECPDHDGSTRYRWTAERLNEYQNDPEDFEKAILRAANPREYPGNLQFVHQATSALNDVLATEEVRIVHEKGVPKFETFEFDFDTSTASTTPPAVFDEDMSQLVQDPRLAQLIESRLAQAARSRDSGDHLAAIILLGSALEGVLWSFVGARSAAGLTSTDAPTNRSGSVLPIDDWKLFDLIGVAHDCGWLERDAMDFSHVLRDYRNLVHPKKQLDGGYRPDGDTCRICWEVMAAVISDLRMIVAAETGSTVSLTP